MKILGKLKAKLSQRDSLNRPKVLLSNRPRAGLERKDSFYKMFK